MNRHELIGSIRDTLARAGFYVSDICDLRPVSFDVVARRDNQLFIIKILTNIDAFSEPVARELKTLSRVLRGAPMLIGQHTGSGQLESEVVYLRYGIPIMTFETFRDYLIEDVAPIVYAASGGYYVKLDGPEMNRLRGRLNLSLGDLADAVGVSRRAIKMYEDGMNAKIDVAARLEEFLFDRVAEEESEGRRVEAAFDSLMRSFDPFKTMHEIWDEVNTRMDQLLDIKEEMMRRVANMGFEIVPTRRSPFNMLMEQKSCHDVLLSGTGKQDRQLARRARIVSNLSSVTERPAVFFIEGVEKKSIEGTPVISKKELVRIEGSEELMDLILKRRKDQRGDKA